MRWILLLLLLVNVALGGFQFWQSTMPSETESLAELSQFSNLELTPSQSLRLEKASERTPLVADKPSFKCIRITGLSEVDGLPVVESRLRALEVEIVKEQARVVLRTDYQIIYGPFASSDLARTEMQAIGSKGIESYIITSGNNQNALSLGVFSSEANANRKVEELNSLEIQATIASKEHFGDSINLMIPKDSATLISDSTLQSILSSFKNAKFSRYTCD
jgi:hypothetical protein